MKINKVWDMEEPGALPLFDQDFYNDNSIQESKGSDNRDHKYHELDDDSCSYILTNFFNKPCVDKDIPDVPLNKFKSITDHKQFDEFLFQLEDLIYQYSIDKYMNVPTVAISNYFVETLDAFALTYFYAKGAENEFI